MMIPEDFRCPISLEIMSDPVILSSGHTFDRSSIQRWFDSGHLTCPISNLPLNPSPPLLIPNHTLRKLISQFTSTTTSSKPPQLCHSDLLLQLYSPHLRLPTLKLLLHLSLNDDEVKVGLVADGAVDRIVECFVNETPAVRSLAATVITSLAVADVNKCTIGAHPKAMFGLVGILRDGKNWRERKEAATALYVLCGFSENRRRIVRYGAVPVLVELAESGMERAVEVLALVGKCKEGRVEMGKIESFVQIMVRIVDMNVSCRAVENALVVLELLFSDDGGGGSNLCAKDRVLEVVGRLVGNGNGNGIGNEKVGRNAGKLLQTLSKPRSDTEVS